MFGKSSNQVSRVQTLEQKAADRAALFPQDGDSQITGLSARLAAVQDKDRPRFTSGKVFSGGSPR